MNHHHDEVKLKNKMAADRAQSKKRRHLTLSFGRLADSSNGRKSWTLDIDVLCVQEVVTHFIK